jgi:hypothetical protein
MKRAALAIALASVLVSRGARADGWVPERTFFAPVGVNLGYGINPRGAPNGFLFGGELSLVYFDRLRWIGAYADVIYDFGAKQTRASVGPEIGALCFTVDGGYVAGDAGKGWVVRLLFDMVVPHVYARVGGLVDRGDQYGEIGILLKLPAPIAQVGSSEDRTRPPPPPAPPPQEEAPTPEGPLAPDEPASPSPQER